MKPNEIPDRALTSEETEDDLRNVRERFQIMQSYWSDIHLEALEDDKFVAGDQWPEDIRSARDEDGRPCLTYNLLPAYGRQITNRVRQERPQIKVVPVQSTSAGKKSLITNVAGNKDYSIADVYSGIIRNIEHISRADQAYDTAVKHAVDHGFGFFYVINEWDEADPFTQTLKIHRVKNSYSVLMDPGAQEADLRDAQDAFMFTTMDKNTFEAKWPDKTAIPFESTSLGSTYEGWYESDSIRIAQYFYIDYKDDEVIKMSNGMTHYLSDVEDVLDEIERDTGVHIVEVDGEEMRKPVKRPVCMWMKISAHDILEGPTELPFSAIPIFFVSGEEVLVDGKVQYESAFRHARDPQRSYNYFRTSAAEAVGLAPKAPYTITNKQLKGNEHIWDTLNETNHPYLPYNSVEGTPPPSRQFPSQVAAAELQNAQADAVDLQSIIGIHDASLGKASNEISGKAITARQTQGNTSTFQFPDNLTRALEQMGRLMVEAIPRIYDTPMTLRIRGVDNKEDFVAINQSILDEQTGERVIVHDIGVGRYDVIMETGPSYATQRQEAAELQMEMLRVLGPEKASNIVHLIIKNLGVPGGDEVYDILRKMLPAELKSPEEIEADLPPGVSLDEQGQPVDEQGNPWQPPPSPEQQIAMKQQQVDEAKAQAEQATAEAKMATAEADKVQAQAKIESAKAEQAKLQSELQSMQAETGQPAIDMQEIERIIQTVMQEHEQNQMAHKESVEEQVVEAAVDTLKRVKTYVDKQAKTQAAPEQKQQTIVVKDTPKEKRPVKVEHKYDKAGNLIESKPVYKSGEE